MLQYKMRRPGHSMQVSAQAQGPGSSRLRVATFNMRDLGNPEVSWRDDDASKAQVIKAVDADVWLLQEVASCKALERFMHKHLGNRAYAHYRFFQTNDPGMHHMALLSRYPIVSTGSNRNRALGMNYHGRPVRFARDLAKARVDVNGIPFQFYNIHFIANRKHVSDSAPLEEREYRNRLRMAEATAIRAVLEEDFPSEGAITSAARMPAPSMASMRRMPNAFYFVGGDGNFTPGSAEHAALMGTGPSQRLVDPLGRRETHTHPGAKDRTDYLLFSRVLAGALIPGSVKVYRGPGSDEASDHLALFGDIDLSKVRAIANGVTLAPAIGNDGRPAVNPMATSGVAAAPGASARPQLSLSVRK